VSRSWKDFAKEKDCNQLTFYKLGLCISKNYTVGISRVFDISQFMSQVPVWQLLCSDTRATQVAECGLCSGR